MKTRAAVAYEVNAPWQVEEFEINDPGPEEMLVKMSFAGLCHSDEHIRMGDFTEAALPMVCGHEGAGVVEAVGDRVRGFKPGDHVAASFSLRVAAARPAQAACSTSATTARRSWPAATSSSANAVR